MSGTRGRSRRPRAEAERRVVEDGGESAHDARAAQPVDAALDGGRAERDAARDIVVRLSSVLGEQRNDSTIRVVHGFDSCTKLLRFGTDLRRTTP